VPYRRTLACSCALSPFACALLTSSEHICIRSTFEGGQGRRNIPLEHQMGGLVRAERCVCVMLPSPYVPFVRAEISRPRSFVPASPPPAAWSIRSEASQKTTGSPQKSRRRRRLICRRLRLPRMRDGFPFPPSNCCTTDNCQTTNHHSSFFSFFEKSR